MRKSQGFTLIELMVTIGVLAIIATMAAPKFQNTIEKRAIQNSTTDLEKALAQARADAVLYRKEVTVYFETDGIDDAANRYWSPREGVTLEFHEGKCGSGNKWSTTKMTTPLSSIKFLPQGNVSGLPSNLEIRFINDESENYLYLSNFGRVSSSKISAFDGGC